MMKACSILILLLLVALMLSSCASRPAFNATAFGSEYEAALTNKDFRYFEEYFSKKYWVGNQYRTREEALAALTDMFNSYEKLQADFVIHSVKFLPGGRSFIMQASLTLYGRHSDDAAQAWLPINEVTGSAVCVYEDGKWRLYKTVEKSLDVPF